MTLTPIDFHPATDALVAFVDGELTPGAHARAAAHVARCVQCATDVAAQREAKRALTDAGIPGLSADLLSRLRDLPFTTMLPPRELDGPGGPTFTTGSPADEPGTSGPGPGRAIFSAPRGGFFMRSVAPPDRRGPAAPPDRRPQRAAPVARTPRPAPTLRLRRFRRGLVGVLAGFAVSVLATAVAPVAGTAGVGAVEPRQAGSVDPLARPNDNQFRDSQFRDDQLRDDAVTVVSTVLAPPTAPTTMSLLAVTGGGR